LLDGRVTLVAEQMELSGVAGRLNPISEGSSDGHHGWSASAAMMPDRPCPAINRRSPTAHRSVVVVPNMGPE